MKNITKSLVAIFSILAMSCSTDDVQDRPVITGIDAPVLLTPEEGNNYTLVIENAELQAERFVWTTANFGGDVVVDYVIEMDNAADNFASPVILGATAGATNLSISTENLNAKVIELGGEPEVNAEYQIRVKSSVGAVAPMYSNIITVSVTPFQAFVPLKHLYIMGDATEYDYNNNAGNAPMFRDPANQNLFHFRGYFLGDKGIKLIETLGAWQPQYGSAGNGVLAVNAGGGTDPDPIAVPTTGYYDLTVDIENMTYTLVPFDYDPVTMPTFASVGVIGAGTPGGWDNDTDLTSSTFNPHLWKVTDITITADALKFRANDSWALPGNWGAGVPVAGVMNIDGGDFVAVNVAGDYNVWFNDLDRRYIFIPAN